MTETAAALLPLTTERLTLRAHRADDAGWLHRIYSQPAVARFLLDEPWDESRARQEAAERAAKTGLQTESGALACVIEHGGEPIGDVLLWLTDRQRDVAEIGWVLDPGWGGRGFAAEAVAAVLRAGFERCRLHRIAAQMDARNTASARLAERVGLRREAHLREDWWNKGEWTDTLIYAALASDPRSAASAD